MKIFMEKDCTMELDGWMNEWIEVVREQEEEKESPNKLKETRK